MEEKGGIMVALNIKGFPDDLYQILSKRAQKDRRSLTGEVIYLLERALETSSEEEVSILQLKGLGKNLWKNVDAAKHIKSERDSWE